MTLNQLKYQELKETIRSNKEKEAVARKDAQSKRISANASAVKAASGAAKDFISPLL